MKKLLSLALSLLLVFALCAPALAEEELTLAEQAIAWPDNDNLFGVPLTRGMYEGVEVRIWTPWPPSTQPRAAQAFEAYTGAKIVYEFGGACNDENATEYRQAVINAVAAGNAPDVIDAANFAIPLWAKKNIVAPWDDFVDFSLGYDALHMTAMMGDLFVYEGGHYGIADVTAPLWNTSVIFYSKSAFENAGLDDPYELFKEGKWDWATFTQACNKLTYDGGSGAIDHWGFTSWFAGEIFVAANGGDVVKTIEGVPTYALNMPESLFALNYAAENMPVMPSTDEVGPDDYFANGSAAMYYEGWWYVDDARDIFEDDLGLVPFPNGPDYDASPSRDYGEWCWAWMLTTQARNPQAAADYFRYAWSPKTIDGEGDFDVWGGEEMYQEILGWAANAAMDTTRGYGNLSDRTYEEIWWSIGDDTPANLVESFAQEAQSIIDDAMK